MCYLLSAELSKKRTCSFSDFLNENIDMSTKKILILLIYHHNYCLNIENQKGKDFENDDNAKYIYATKYFFIFSNDNISLLQNLDICYQYIQDTFFNSYFLKLVELKNMKQVIKKEMKFAIELLIVVSLFFKKSFSINAQKEEHHPSLLYFVQSTGHSYQLLTYYWPHEITFSKDNCDHQDWYCYIISFCEIFFIKAFFENQKTIDKLNSCKNNNNKNYFCNERISVKLKK
ncbi:hypothetical protein RFI_00039 [Reticulomyxa filosa]|uniref:Uncharacterized protein n=1 Tax=Reticulomyxa filosa TaxID=46433 RepID=X6PFZ0_RETFI|nr:hypothetical protein RFI_00039 [Reticulomyxa filosa]|eukprot:ETO37023.1 hypothetical protein RFI_00039 [Reticulomyxa filosa]